MEPLNADDERIVAEQLGRRPRGLIGVAWRCPCGRPGVVATEPRLPTGAPFPTFYYLTCPNAVAGCSRLEANGVMAQMNRELASDPQLASQYAAAHEAYLDDRAQYGEVHEIAGYSAGGMPDRVKCLHALVGHALAAGPGVNPLGDRAVELLGEFWNPPCRLPGDDEADTAQAAQHEQETPGESAEE